MTDVDDILALAKEGSDVLDALALRDVARTARLKDLLDQIAATQGKTLTADQVTAVEAQLTHMIDMAKAAAPEDVSTTPPEPLPGPFGDGISAQPAARKVARPAA